MKSPKSYYENLAELAITKRKELSRQISYISIIRVIIFLGTVLGIWLSWGADLIDISILLAGIMLFLVFVKVNEALFKKRELEEAKELIAKDNIDRINLKLGNLSNGETYIDSRHQYSYVLDIFVSTSLFSLSNSTCTALVNNILASCLVSPMNVRSNIQFRQIAV